MEGIEGVKILVVDDDQLTLEFLEVFFVERNAKMKKASSVRVALKTVDSWLPDVIISDIGLPDEDGLAFIRSLQSREQTKDIPVIAVTGYSSGIDRQKFEAAGYAEVLIKPVDPEQLCMAVERATRNK